MVTYKCQRVRAPTDGVTRILLGVGDPKAPAAFRPTLRATITGDFRVEPQHYRFTTSPVARALPSVRLFRAASFPSLGTPFG